MSDYKQRFQEKFGPVDPEVLAFIDEIVRETELEAGYHTGREHERAALIEKVEGMRKTYEGREDLGAQFCRGILDDLLTHLRGEGLCIFHKDKNCCAYDEKQRSGTQEKPLKDLGEFVNAPEEKKRKVMLEVAREATNDQRAQIGLPPLPQSGIQTNYVDSRTPDEKANEPDSVVTTAQSFQEETECCEKCIAYPSLGNFKGFGDTPYCRSEKLCPCHKPRTEFKKFREDEAKLSKLPRTEETRCKHGYIKLDHCLPEFGEITGIKETEKEGASFSGRDVVAEFEARFPEAEYGERELELPQNKSREWCWNRGFNHARQEFRHFLKETPTPQSREQGGKEQYPFYPLKVPYCKCDDPKCPLREPETNQ